MSVKYLFLITFVTLFVARSVFGQDTIINCDNNEKCSLSSLNSLFSKSEVWIPGKTVSKIIRIVNSSNSLKSINSSIQSQSSGSLDKVLNLSIKRNKDNTLIWFGNIKDFNSGINLGDFEPNKSEDYIYTISMDKSSTNEYQNKKVDFDIIFEFRGDLITVTPTMAKQLLAQNYISPTIDQIFIEPTVKGEVKGLGTKKNDKLMFMLKVMGIELIIVFGYLIFRLIFFKSH